MCPRRGPLTSAHVPAGFFEMKMKYDESDNALIRASRALTDKVTDLLGEWAAPRPSLPPGLAAGTVPGPSPLPTRCLQGACSRRRRCQRCSQRSCESTPPLTRSGSCDSVRATSSPTCWRWAPRLAYPGRCPPPVSPGSRVTRCACRLGCGLMKTAATGGRDLSGLQRPRAPDTRPLLVPHLCEGTQVPFHEVRQQLLLS